jgi:hypothetical protein
VPHSAEISRANPTCFLFLLDQSTSMQDPWGGEPGTVKSQTAAMILNRLLQQLVLRCAKSEGIRDYFHVGVIGYGDNVGPILSGALAGNNLVPISAVANNPLRVEEKTRKVEDGAGGVVEQRIKFPIWFEPLASGGTPMCEALLLAVQIVAGFIALAPACYPPVVFNITDGEATDGDPEPCAEELKNLASDDGNVVLYNLHISSARRPVISFPDSEQGLPDAHAQTLFRMSSVLPFQVREMAFRGGYKVSANSRGFLFQAEGQDVIQFLELGTRVDKQLR